ncbi:hypothetical protein HELRODRAFT_100002 [Helobdella robusta]|uniref:Protein arginine N-methyltransferase 7 n=1 Tax=Helobdella robusta TaxID=6412 RepID=T1ECX9_HELRO|nr:hypothetical protein HELRODRAFT_100002 [Helobdella robusta]ESO03732.1 hypothetical protein HELRODRAFT_100002 [Helobdella robusta]
MSTFVSRISPVTGRLEWVMQSDDYDYHQEVARSAYGDMLHDTERNKLYEVGLKHAIKWMHEKGKQAFVLDIGTGTGLLSMIAVRAGADKVVACEAFKPIAECALKVIEANNMADKITIIKKRSTEMNELDLGGRANILVAEVFDTELIGEGALGTFHHACSELLDQNDRIVVPSAAHIICQPVSCPFFRGWHEFKEIKIHDDKNYEHNRANNNTSSSSDTTAEASTTDKCSSSNQSSSRCKFISPPKKVKCCTGAPSVHDVQLNRLAHDHFLPIGDPKIVFSFDFTETSGGPLKFIEHESVNFQAVNDGVIDCIFMWWQLKMDMNGEVILSTAPRWGHPTPNDMQWRDHWMQAVYYPSKVQKVVRGQEFKVNCHHDEYSLWFDLSHPDVISSSSTSKMLVDHDQSTGSSDNRGPGCTCSAHIACSRTRVAMLNDVERNRKYIRALKKVINEDSVCFCTSDDSLLPLIAAKLGAKKVISLQPNQLSRQFLQSYVEANDLQNCVKVVSSLEDEQLKKENVNIIMGDPYYSTSLLPWHNLHFLYAKTELINYFSKPKKAKKKKSVHSDVTDNNIDGSPIFFADQTKDLSGDNLNLKAPSLLSRGDGLVIFPCSASIRAIAVQFENLHKLRGSPVNICEGFDLRPFDQLMSYSSDQSDAYLEPHPLWEYPAIPMTEDFELLFFNFDPNACIVGGVRQLEREGLVEFISSGTCSGIAVWYSINTALNDQTDETDFANDNVLIGGLLSPPQPGQTLNWDPYSRQGVHFFKIPQVVDDGKFRLKFKTVFQPKTGEFEFKFSVISCKI